MFIDLIKHTHGIILFKRPNATFIFEAMFHMFQTTVSFIFHVIMNAIWCSCTWFAMLNACLTHEVLQSPWCRLVHSVDYRVWTPTLTYNTSLNCVTPSSSKTSHLRLPGSICFPSLSWGRQNSGSTRTGKLLIHGANAPLRSSLSSSLWAKLMHYGEESPTSSRHQWNPSWRRGRGCKNTSKHALTTE
jgi:hypothetical protein